MKYRINLYVDIHDVDHNGVARASALMKYIQTAAQQQLNANNMSYDELKESGKAFILSKIKMDFDEPLRSFEPICAVSYPCESRGFSFLRCYTLERDGIIIGRAASVWALVDIESRKLVKVDDFPLGLTLYEPNDMQITRFNLPADMTDAGSYHINYSDIDQNGHMNNTRYPDMFSNFLPLDGKRIKTISISYQNEAPRGEKLRILRSQVGENLFYLRSLREDGKVNADAEILLTDI